MRRISWRHNRERLILPVVVLPGLSSVNATEMIRAEGLLDTGATGTGVRADIAASLQLRRKGTRRVYTANGMIMASEYVIRIGLVLGDYIDPFFEPERQQPYVLERELVGFELAASFAYPLLIGMDVIGASDLHLRPDGTATLDLG